MRVAICDDDPLIRNQLTDMVNRITGEKLCTSFADGDRLLAAMQEDEYYDVILMDIEWEGEEQGIHLAGQIGEISPGTCIIYVTGYTLKYIQQVFLRPANVTGFLVKPVDEELLRENLHKAWERCRERDKKHFVFKYRNIMQMVCFDDIQYIESSAHKLLIVTEKEEYSCYGRLESIMKTFPDDFTHCHKSYLVNLNAVKQLKEDHTFEMKNGAMIPISKNRYAFVRETWFHHIRSAVFGGEATV